MPVAGRAAQAACTDSKRVDHDNRTKDGESRNSSITSHTSQTSHTSCNSGSVSKAHRSGPEDGSGVAVSRPLLLTCRSEPTQEEDTPVAATHRLRCADMVRAHFSTQRSPSECTVPLHMAASTGSGGAFIIPAFSTSRMRDGVYAFRSATASSTACRYHVTASRVLKARRKVVRLLVTVLLVFACCVLPFHIRLLLRYGLHIYLVHQPIGLLDFVSQLLFFLNSALNPVLYSLMSFSFRRCARQVLCCDPRPQRH